MNDLLARAPELAAAHLRLALAALAIGIVISLPLGVWVHRVERVRNAVLGIIGVVQTIPSLALLAFMVPAIAAIAPAIDAVIGVRPSAIGSGPALIALTTYGVLPILQNTVAGLAAVEPALVEAAKGVGMTTRQVLWRVELPLALPIIVAGTRTAAVWTVGTAVLATPIGAPSLGDYIFVGLQTRNQLSVLVGCVLSATLALLLDALIRSLEAALQDRQAARRRARVGWSVAILLGVGLLSFAPLLAAATSGGASKPKARVGAKAFTEGLLFGELFGLIIEEAGFEVEQVGSLGSTVIFDALTSGDIDVYLDFSGTILVNAMKAQVPDDPAEVIPRIRKWLQTEHDIRIAAALGYENRYAFALREDEAKVLGVTNLSQLVSHATSLSVVAGYEFFDRPEWASVQETYGMSFAKKRTMEQALAYEAVRTDQAEIVVAYSTDARVESLRLRLLDDDQHAIPPYEGVVLVRGAFADAHPNVMRRLHGLDGRFTEARVRRMNQGVDEGQRSPRQVAQEVYGQILGK